MLSMFVPLYISEISPPEIRGALLVLEEFSIVTGIVSASIYIVILIADVMVGCCVGYLVCNPIYTLAMGLETAVVAPDFPWSDTWIWHRIPAIQPSVACLQRSRG